MRKNAPCRSRPWPPELTAAAAILLQAARFADEIHCSWWNFAVEIAEFHRLGVTNSGLRLLVCHGFIDHAEELVGSQRDDRTFQPTCKLAIAPHTCFVLTGVGRVAAEQLISTSLHQLATRLPPCAPRTEPGKSGSDQHDSLFDSNSAIETSEARASVVQPRGRSTAGRNGAAESFDPQFTPEQLSELKPIWDDELYRLSFGALIVKEYRTPAPNQQLILAAFQEEGWPPRIDDPLPPAPDLEPKRRLHETIISLNRNQRNSVLKFCGDGHGEGVRWEVAARRCLHA